MADGNSESSKAGGLKDGVRRKWISRICCYCSSSDYAVDAWYGAGDLVACVPLTRAVGGLASLGD